MFEHVVASPGPAAAAERRTATSSRVPGLRAYLSIYVSLSLYIYIYIYTLSLSLHKSIYICIYIYILYVYIYIYIIHCIYLYHYIAHFCNASVCCRSDFGLILQIILNTLSRGLPHPDEQSLERDGALRCQLSQKSPTARTPNLHTNIVDFTGLDSSIILISRGGIPRPIGNFPQSLSQAMLVGTMLVGRLSVPRMLRAAESTRGIKLRGDAIDQCSGECSGRHRKGTPGQGNVCRVLIKCLMSDNSPIKCLSSA